MIHQLKENLLIFKLFQLKIKIVKISLYFNWFSLWAFVQSCQNRLTKPSFWKNYRHISFFLKKFSLYIKELYTLIYYYLVFISTILIFRVFFNKITMFDGDFGPRVLDKGLIGQDRKVAARIFYWGTAMWLISPPV